MLKPRKLNGAFGCFSKNVVDDLQMVFWKLELLRKIKSKEAKWCILALFETVFWKLELLRTC